MKYRHTCFRAIIPAILLPMGSGAMAQLEDTPEPIPAAITSFFRIGYLGIDPEASLGGQVFVRLRDYLAAAPSVQAGMQTAGITDIRLRSFESHRDLSEELNEEQLDVAFCSGIDFVNQRSDSYEPLFQIRRPGDYHPPIGPRVYYSGVVFVNNRSALFPLSKEDTTRGLAQYLASHEVAMVDRNSASGYIYPYLKLQQLCGQTTPAQIQTAFWQDPREVVKAVVSGVHEIGACDAGVVDEVLSTSKLLNQKQKLIREIAWTAFVPRDPVVFHSRHAPTRSALGREVARAMQEFFARDRDLPKLEPSSKEPFKELRDNLQKFYESRKALPK